MQGFKSSIICSSAPRVPLGCAAPEAVLLLLSDCFPGQPSSLDSRRRKVEGFSAGLANDHIYVYGPIFLT